MCTVLQVNFRNSFSFVLRQPNEKRPLNITGGVIDDYGRYTLTYRFLSLFSSVSSFRIDRSRCPEGHFSTWILDIQTRKYFFVDKLDGAGWIIDKNISRPLMTKCGCRDRENSSALSCRSQCMCHENKTQRESFSILFST